MTEFKQIIGRGTRLREKEGKTHFVVMDFRNVTRLFADPDWDGPVEINSNYGTSHSQRPQKPDGGDPPAADPSASRLTPFVDRNGCKVTVVRRTVSIYDANGSLLRQESLEDYTREKLRGEYTSLDHFVRQWNAQEKKEKIRDLLREWGVDLAMLRADQDLDDVDDFDFICHAAFGGKLLTRRERAEHVRERDFFSRYGGPARAVLEALLDKYITTGIYEIERIEVLKLDPFLKMGRPAKIAGYFGGRDGYLKAVRELEREIYLDEDI